MAEYQTAKSYVDSSQAIDMGLRAHMNKVYGLMSLAMLITGAVAYAVGTTPALVMAIFGTWLQWVVMLAPLGVVFMFSAKIHSMRTQTAQLVFWIFAALIGLSISYIFLAYTDINCTNLFYYCGRIWSAQPLWIYNQKRPISFGEFLVYRFDRYYRSIHSKLVFSKPSNAPCNICDWRANFCRIDRI